MVNFDDYAKEYRDIHNKNLNITGLSSDYFAENKVKIVANETYELNEYKILDIGCGDGKLEEYMIKYFNYYEVDGIDISSESIEQAKKKNIRNSKFFVYDGQKIPFKDCTYDIILISGVLHHIDKGTHVSLLNEAYRVMSKGASVFIFEHNPFNPFTQYIVKTCIFDEDATLLKHTYSKRICEKVGFFINKLAFISFFPDKFIFKYLIKYENKLWRIPMGGQYYIHGIKK